MTELDVGSRNIREKHVEELEAAMAENEEVRKRMKNQESKIGRLEREV
jgi:hypothetical protein